MTHGLRGQCTARMTPTATSTTFWGSSLKNGRRTCLLSPLRSDGVVTGVLILSAKTQGLFDGLQNLVEWIANGLSIAIERNRLSAAVLKRNRELETISSSGSALASSTFDMKKVPQIHHGHGQGPDECRGRVVVVS